MAEHSGVSRSTGGRVAEEGAVYRLHGRVQVGEANVPFERAAVATSYGEARALVTQAVGVEMGVDETEVEIAPEPPARFGHLPGEMGAFDHPSAAA